jgi:hypothetical protein
MDSNQFKALAEHEAHTTANVAGPMALSPELLARAKSGHPRGTTNLHSKQPSGIAKRLRAAGVDWVIDLAAAIKSNNETRINMWLRLLPYLIVTQGHRRIKKGKGRVSRAALSALAELEGE